MTQEFLAEAIAALKEEKEDVVSAIISLEALVRLRSRGSINFTLRRRGRPMGNKTKKGATNGTVTLDPLPSGT